MEVRGVLNGKVPAKRAGMEVRIAPFALLAEMRRARQALGVFATLVRLGMLLIKFRPQVVSCHFVRDDCYYFVLLKVLFGFRLVLSAHGSDVLMPQARSSKRLGRVLSSADAVTAVNGQVADAAGSRMRGRSPSVSVIRNSVSVSFWSGLRRSSIGSGRRSRVLSVGRLSWVKGHDVLLEAFSEVVSHCPGASLGIVGSGERRSELIDLARRLGIADRVTFYGNLSQFDIRGLLREADVFVLPSRSEGTPLALMEALLAGVPAVASRVGGVEQIGGGRGAVLVEPGCPGALCDAIVEVLTDLRLARRLHEETGPLVSGRNDMGLGYLRLFERLVG